MKNSQQRKILKSPILFIVFNRLQLAERVFDVIKKVKPEKLFIVADGPRKEVTSDNERCDEVRKLVNRVDWDCKVEKKYFESNQGCGVAPSKGISWFFDNVDQGIILEDDCLPDESFIWFCETLLNRYKNEPRVMHINGNNFNTSEFAPSSASYHFGSYPQVWGWATWKRAWDSYDFGITSWPEIEKNKLLSHMGWRWYEKTIQRLKFSNLYKSKRTDIWDYQWHLAVFRQNGLTIVPKVNLVSNIGFGKDATHTTQFRGSCTNLETGAITFPLQHPDKLLPDMMVDKVYRRIIVGAPSTLYLIIWNQVRGYAGRVYRKLRGWLF